MKKLLCLILAAGALFSCAFKNDLDYPVVPASVLSVEVEHAKSVKIDASSRTVFIELDERANLEAVHITRLEVTEEASYESIPEILDLREPYQLTLKTWQEYRWTIQASQEIQRYVRCKNQLQNARFNVELRTVFVYVPDTQPLSSLTIEQMKLEPEGWDIVSTTGYISADNHRVLVSQSVSLPMELDCVMERTFEVLGPENQIVTWKFKAFQLEVKMQVSEVNPHAYSATVRGTFSAGSTPRIEYRKASQADWVIASNPVIAGVGISAKLTGLEDDTDYLCRVADETGASAEVSFHTKKAVQPDNMGFEDWYQDGKVWYPFLQGGTAVWDSANKATASFTGSITSPDASFKTEGNYSVRMESSFAVVKFASASIFTGSFVKLQGMGALLDWGIPFNSTPVGLNGQIAYKPKAIDYADSRYADKKGQMDTGHVVIILTDWEEPFRIASAEEKFVDFQNDPAIIAYGRYALSETTDGFQPFHIDLEYRSQREPRYLVIVAASSALGDYYTGGVGSTLWLDDLSLEYD